MGNNVDQFNASTRDEEQQATTHHKNASDGKTRGMHAKKTISLGGYAAGSRRISVSFNRTGYQPQAQNKKSKKLDAQVATNAEVLIDEGREAFRFDTFGDEAFWGGTLGLHNAIKGAGLGGVGPGLSPNLALSLGLKVDLDALPRPLQRDLERGRVNLDDPAVTVALLRLDAVVGVKGFFQGDSLTSVGITCALCHSQVDNSLLPGIGDRLDGWANRDLNVGEIIAFAPDLSPFATLLGVSQDTVRQVVRSWGPGKFDAELILDGKAVNPFTGMSGATLIPPAFGLAGVNLHTWTGWGSVTHWNAFVANLEMQGKGTFFDPRLNNAAKFPIAAANGFGNVRNTPDLITPKLAALHLYQLAIPAPTPPAGSFNADAASRGKRSSMARRSVQFVTCRPCSQSRDGTCTRPPRLE